MNKGPGRQLHFDLPPLDTTSPVSAFVVSKRRRNITLALVEQLEHPDCPEKTKVWWRLREFMGKQLNDGRLDKKRYGQLLESSDEWEKAVEIALSQGSPGTSP